MYTFRIAIPLLLAASCQAAAFAGSVGFNVGQNYLNEWQGFTNGLGRKPAGISVYGDIYSGALNSDSQNLLASYAQSNNGNVEIGFSWKDAMTVNGYTQYQGAKLQYDIANGKYDVQLQNFGAYLARFPNVKFLMRVEYEVSTNFFANTNPNAFDPSTFDLKAYPLAYRHVRSIIASRARNVKFVYHAVRSQAKTLYPGDDVVDLIGFSVFNNDVCLPVASTTNCQGSRIDPNLLGDIKWAPKPKIIAESAVQPPASNSQSGTIDYLTRVRDIVLNYPGFVGWTYINSNWPAHGWGNTVWGDSRIETQSSVKSWFQSNVLNNGAFYWG